MSHLTLSNFDSTQSNSFDLMPLKQQIRVLMVQVMVISLQYWQQCTFRSKLDLASESNIWSIHIDHGSPQTRTLDKYLHIDTLPNRPKIEDVVRTAYFVLHHGQNLTPLRLVLEETLSSLMTLQQEKSLSSES